MADAAARRNYRLALAAFVIGLAAFVFEAIVTIAYIGLIQSTQDAVTEFGWGNVPPERLEPFIRLSGAMGPLLIGCVLVASIATMFLFYFAARSLRREGIKQHFGPALTAWSSLIPFYNFYRPWAGLGEVRNSLRQARREGKLPAAGIRGANAATVFYAIATVIYGIAQQGIGGYAGNIADSSDTINDAAQFNAFLGKLSGLFSLNAIVDAIFLLVVLWYWIGTLRLMSASLRLAPASVEAPSPPPLPPPVPPPMPSAA